MTKFRFCIRFLQGELRHGQLDGADRAAQQGAHRNPRAQSCPADIRLVQSGAGGTAELHGSPVHVKVSAKRKQHHAVVFGPEWFFLPTRTHAPRRLKGINAADCI